MGCSVSTLFGTDLWTNEELNKKYNTGPHSVIPGKDYLLAARCLGLCLLSYYNKHLNPVKFSDFEEKWIKALAIHDIKWWNEKVTIDVVNRTFMPSQALTGYIRNLDEDAMGNIPFICFRDTKAMDDVIRDLKSFDVAPMKLRGPGSDKKGEPGSPVRHSRRRQAGSGMGGITRASSTSSINSTAGSSMSHHRSGGGIASNGCARAMLMPIGAVYLLFRGNNGRRRRHRVVGLTGAHYYEKWTFYQKQGILHEMVNQIEKFRNGIIICGHGLGAAIANLFFTELAFNYPQLIQQYKEKIRIVTFGEPRCFNIKLSKKLNKLPITKLRYLNENDIVTGLPSHVHHIYQHFGNKVYYAQKLSKKLQSLEGFYDYGWDFNADTQLKRQHLLFGGNTGGGALFPSNGSGSGSDGKHSHPPPAGHGHHPGGHTHHQMIKVNSILSNNPSGSNSPELKSKSIGGGRHEGKSGGWFGGWGGAGKNKVAVDDQTAPNTSNNTASSAAGGGVPHVSTASSSMSTSSAGLHGHGAHGHHHGSMSRTASNNHIMRRGSSALMLLGGIQDYSNNSSSGFNGLGAVGGNSSLRGFDHIHEDLRPHSLVNEYGYLRQLFQCPAYLAAVKEVHEPRLKRLYMNLPIDWDEIDEFENADGDLCENLND